MKKYQKYHDKELLCFLAAGDDQAFTEIYHRYWKLLFGIAFTHLKKTQLAEDIVHDVLASLWKNRHCLEILSLKNYLASATKYMVLHAIRKNMRIENHAVIMNEPVSGFDIENAFHHKQLIEFVNKEIEFLPERCRVIFRYSRDKGMTTREIANELKIATKTVENQMNKALHHLRFSMRKMLQSLFNFF